MQILKLEKERVFIVKPRGVESEKDVPGLIKSELGLKCEPLCVHRLDLNVGGVMVYALCKDEAARLSRLIRENRFEKRYLAVLEGEPQDPRGEYRDLLFKDSRQKKSFIVDRMRAGVREAALFYETLAGKDGLSLVRVRLETGRSHQIRAQFAFRKTPLFGDGKYGARRKGNIALWSESVAFPASSGGEMRVSCPPPGEAPWDMFESDRR